VKRQIPIALVIAPALLIAAAVGFFLLVKPKMDSSSSLDERIVEFQGKVDVALAAQRQATPGATIKVADLFRLTKAMPESTDMAGVILELNSVAERSGVDFLAITPGAPTAAPGGYQSVPIKLTFEGNYYDLTDFLFRLRNLVIVRDGELETAGRLFTLDALDLHEGTLGFPQVQAGLSVSAYTYAPGAAPAPGATPAPAATTPPTATTPAATTTAPTTTTPAPGQDPSALGTG
jgi:Tfp pilus assembly protein PilO